MPFKYSVEPDKIVFTRLGAGCSQAMFIGIGSLFTVIGICLFIFIDNPVMPLSGMRFLFPVMGLLAVYVGIKLPKIQSKSTPDSITFYNNTGRVEVAQKASGIQSAFMYYDEIEGFIYKAKSQRSSSSSTTTNRTTYTYHIYLVKKDGAQWELLKLNSEIDAIAEVAKLSLLVNLKVTPQKQAVSLAESPKYKISNSGNSAEITWRNSVGMGPVYLLLFVCVFCFVGYIFIGAGFIDNDFPVFAYVVVGFIATIFVVVVGFTAANMFKNSKTIYAVSITDHSFDYFEKDLAGRIRKDIRFPLSDLRSISFSFDTESTLRKIFIYTHDQFEQMKNMRVTLSFQAIKDMYTFYSGLVSLNMQDLTAVEALQMENYIQQQIALRGNSQVA
jgi:hypothetical protein